MLNRLFNWITLHPVVTLLMVFVAVAGASAGLTRFDTNHDPRTFFGPENPEFQRFETFEAKYGARDIVLWAIHPKNNDVFTQRNLTIIEELTRKGWEMPKAVRVQSMTNFQHTEVNGDELRTSFLVENPQTLSDEALARIKSIALNEPALLHGAVSPKGHVAAVVVTIMLEEGRRSAPAISRWAEAVRDEYRQRYPDVDFYLVGTVVFSEAMSRATDDSFKRIFPISVLAAVLALLLMLRSVTGTVLTVLIVTLSISSAMGVASYFGLVFQPVTSFGPAIILTLGVADCIHILITYQMQLRSGMQQREAIIDSMRTNFQPVFLTSLTTAIGFLFMNTSESPPFRDLGNLVVFGVTFAFILTVVMLPALLALLKPPQIAGQDAWSQQAMDRFAGFVVRRRAPLLWSSVVAIIVLSAFIPQNRFNDVWHEYFDDSYEVRRANDYISQELSGMHRIEFSIPAGEMGGISEPEYLRHLEAFREWAEAQPEVVYTINYPNVIKRLNRDMNGGDPALYRLPDSRELAAQYLLMYELSLPFGLGLDNQMTMDKDETLFSIVLYRTSSGAVLDFARRSEQWIQTHFPPQMQVAATGLDTLFGGVSLRNTKSMISGTLAAFLLISLTIMVALRSVRYGLISLLPNVLPAGMAFGLWGVLSGEIGLSVSVVACLTIGIVVDDTIHFLSKYVRAKHELKLSTEQAVRYSFRTVGVAMVSTSIILVANFGVMAFSGFYPSSSLGVLTAITIALALIVDFLFFAPLLLTLDLHRVRHSSATLPEPASEVRADSEQAHPRMGGVHSPVATDLIKP